MKKKMNRGETKCMRERFWGGEKKFQRSVERVPATQFSSFSIYLFIFHEGKLKTLTFLLSVFVF